MTVEASARARGNVRRGKLAEQQVAAYLRQWWPGAVRAVRTGSSAAPDPGDIAGVPGLIASVKDAASEEWAKWWRELDAMRTADPAALAVVIHKARGHADPAMWWVHLHLDELAMLLDSPDAAEVNDPVRVRLSTLVALLVARGYAR